MSAKRAVVTGGAGFIGSHMVELLMGKGFDVRVVDNMTGGREANVAPWKGNGMDNELRTPSSATCTA